MPTVLAVIAACDFNVAESISTVFLALPKQGVVEHDCKPGGHSLLLLLINARVDERPSEENCVVKPNPMEVPSGHLTDAVLQLRRASDTTVDDLSTF